MIPLLPQWSIAVERSAVLSHFSGIRQFRQIAIVVRRRWLAVIVFRCRCVGYVVRCGLG